MRLGVSSTGRGGKLLNLSWVRTSPVEEEVETIQGDGKP